MKADFLKDLLKRSTGSVAVFGKGLSGRAVEDLLNKEGYACDIFDQKDKWFGRENARNCSLVITSPGFSPSHEWIKLAKDEGRTIITELDLGMCYSRAKSIVGITGTNGKTSLTTILSHLANNLDLPSIALGNIGYPLSSAETSGKTIGKNIFLETSSFQACQSTVLRLDSLLWTNFSPDHLDYHLSEREYFLAKLKLANRCKNSNNVWIGESVVSNARKFGISLNPNFQVVQTLGKKEIPSHVDSFFKSVPQCENLAFALQWTSEFGISHKQFFEAIEGYQPEPHRLQKVDDVDQVSFWNDSKSTNLASVVAACRSFSEKIIWIGGGKNKGQQAGDFAKSLKPYLAGAYLIGEMSMPLNQSLQERGIKSTICKSLKDALHLAFQAAVRQQKILFSPGFSSFDMFSNYSVRGNSFKSLVFDLKRSSQEDTKLPVTHLQISY